MINVVFFTAIILVFLRLIGFLIVTPVFFPKGTPVIVKMGFALILAYIIIPGVDYKSVGDINNIFYLMGCFISEVTTGITLGFITRLCFMAVKMGANVMDLEVGFSMMSMLDPNSNSNSTLIERLLYFVSLVVFFIVDGHHMLILQIINSFKSVSLGKFILNGDSPTIVIEVFIKFFVISIKMAIPIILIIILTDLTLGLIARTVPQLNVMILGLPIKIIVGLASVAFALPILLNLISDLFSYIPDAFKGIYKTIPVIFIFASEEKTEDPTPHKLSDARKKGQVAKSKEVNMALTLLAATLVLSVAGDYVFSGLKDIMTIFFNNFINMEVNYDNVYSITVLVIFRMALIILPVALPIMIVGVFSNILQTGFIHTKEPLKPDFKKINPISGFKRLFSARTFVELIKDLAMVSIVGIVGYKFLIGNYEKIINLNNLRFPVLMGETRNLAVSIFLKITLIMIAIALVDFIFQKKQYKKDMKMTKQEVKEEFKQEEGDPQIKGKIKQKQREMAMSRMMQSVPDATVVVTNPTHIAIAIKYKDGEDCAPIVVAKGKDYVALKIKEKARESNVPIIENKPLARLMYKEVELDSEILPEMYQAVAEILAVVMKLEQS